jgi:LacI family repressor for deo operon, udp, cdd, tsx, nupC, and nupG
MPVEIHVAAGKRGRQGGKSRTMTLRDVAGLAGVSTATVSRALEKPDTVAEATRARIMEAVAACGYTPNIMARNLRKMETRLVTILIADVTNPFFNEIVRGIERVARENGYSVLLADSENDPGQENAYGGLLAAKRTDGMILLNGRMPAGLLPAGGEASADAPVVVACEYLPNLDLPTIQIDNIDAAKRATEHLLSLGHRRVGFITGPLWNVLSRDRLSGYRDAVLDAGLGFDDALVVPGNFSIRSGIEATERLLALSSRPTAIFASNDEMAIGAIRAARDGGLRIPADLSIMGFDDIRFAAYVDPPLSTIRQPGQEIGRRAMEMLVRIMAGKPLEERRILLPTELVVRGSTAPPRISPLS